MLLAAYSDREDEKVVLILFFQEDVMKFKVFALFLVPVSVWSASLEKEVKLCLSADAPLPAGVKVSGSVRKVPGKFGKAFLIERRTVNFFDPADVILTGGAALTGKSNKLTLPANGCAALPLTGLRKGSRHTLSFLYSGSGKIKVLLDDAETAVFEAGKAIKEAEVTLTALEDSHTIRITALKGACLNQVMLDKNCIFANTYHAPGVKRGVDKIWIDPGKFYNERQGSITLWFKAPWMKKVNFLEGETAFFGLHRKEKRNNRIVEQATHSAVLWRGGIHERFWGRDRSSYGVLDFKFKELEKIAPGEWHFLVFNWKYEKGKLHFDVSVDNGRLFSKSVPYVFGGKPENFSAGSSGGYYLNGAIDDFAVWGRPLTADEKTLLYHSEKPLLETIKGK